MNLNSCFNNRTKQVAISAVMALVMLLSFAAHSHEGSADIQVYEQLDCKLCQQKADPVYRPVTLVKTNIGQFTAHKINARVVSVVRDNYQQPSQRAPPVI
ncbi:hypothetical protein [Thalassotalea sediminis]|uniref:hypothetical protein n=1 Tax=Thalassotalea sediminis TaxID=1759089 RepID=UPI0025742786|nr:hypothetical protein [Thalassotalea sediminis]